MQGFLTMDSVLERLERDAPSFHTDPSGRPVSYSVSHLLRLQLSRYLRPGMNTAEIGCGATTVVFAAAGCNHCCVTPRAEEAEKVVNYCKKIGVDTERLHFAIGRSDRLLPSMWSAGPLDLAFIDGGHSFPYAIIDFHYLQHRIGIGGVLAIDDISIPSVAILVRFITTERQWQKAAVVEETAFFQRVEVSRDGLWSDQLFNRPRGWRRITNAAARLSPRRVIARLRKYRRR
jgi:predicted O-methyltransferase YrrM